MASTRTASTAIRAAFLLAATQQLNVAKSGRQQQQQQQRQKWEIAFEPPVLVTGAINTSAALGSVATRRNVVMLSDSLTVPCLFFPIERYAKNIFSIEQGYGIGNLRYPGPLDQSWEGTPMVRAISEFELESA